jgi:hypothetical protein
MTKPMPMARCRSAVKYHRPWAAKGSAVVLVLATLLGLTAQLLILSLVTTRSLSNEASLSSQHKVVQETLDTALLRFKNTVQAHALANAGDVPAAFNEGGGSALQNASYPITDPATGTPSAGNVIIDAFVSTKRGSYTKLTARGRYNGIELERSQWFRLGATPVAAGPPCAFPAPVQSITTLIANVVDAANTFYVDQAQSRAFFSDKNAASARTFMYKPCLGLTTLFNNTLGSLYHDQTNNNIFLLNDTADIFYWLKADNTLVSVPAMSGADFYNSNVVANPNTGLAYVYRAVGGAASGLYAFNPFTEATTQVATYSWPTSGCKPFVYHVLNPADGRLYMTFDYYDGCTHASNNFMTYHPSTGLSTIVTGRDVGYTSLAVNTNTGHVVFGEGAASTDCRMWGWSAGTGLSTIITNGNRPGHYATVYDIVRGKAYFNTNRGHYIGWDQASGAITTIAPVSIEGMNEGSAFDVDNNTLFIDHNSDGFVFDLNTHTMLPTTYRYAQYTTNSAYCTNHLVCPKRLIRHNDDTLYPVYLNNKIAHSGLPAVTSLYPGVYFATGYANPRSFFYRQQLSPHTLLFTAPEVSSDQPNWSWMNPTSGDVYFVNHGVNDYMYLAGTSQLITLAGQTGDSLNGLFPLSVSHNMDYNHKGVFLYKKNGSSGRVYAYYHLDPNG